MQDALENEHSDGAQCDVLVMWFTAYTEENAVPMDRLVELAKRTGTTPKREEAAAVLLRFVAVLVDRGQRSEMLATTIRALADAGDEAVDEDSQGSEAVLTTARLHLLHRIAATGSDGVAWLLGVLPDLAETLLLCACRSRSSHVTREAMGAFAVLFRHDMQLAYKAIDEWWATMPAQEDDINPDLSCVILDLAGTILDDCAAHLDLSALFHGNRQWANICYKWTQHERRMVRTKAIEVVRRLVRASPALVPTTVLPFHEDVVARLVRSDNPVSAQSGVAILGHLMEHAIKTNASHDVGAICAVFGTLLNELISQPQGDRQRLVMLGSTLDAIPSLDEKDARLDAEHVKGLTDCLLHMVDVNVSKLPSRSLKTVIVSLQRLSVLAARKPEIGDKLLLLLHSASSDADIVRLALQTLDKLLRNLVFRKVCLGRPELRETLVKVLKRRLTDLRWEVRDSALELLATLGTDADQDATNVVQELINDNDDEALVSCLQDSEAYVRASAVTTIAAISKIPTFRALRRLLFDKMGVLVHDSEAFVRRAAIQSLVLFATDAADRELDAMVPSLRFQEFIDDHDWEVRRDTVDLLRALAAHDDYVLDAAFLETLANDLEVPVRSHAVALAKDLLQKSPVPATIVLLEAIVADAAKTDSKKHQDILGWSTSDLFAHQHICDDVMDCY